MSQKGRCRNYEGNCQKAKDREVQIIEDGKPFICKECGNELHGNGSAKKKRKKKKGLDPKILIIGGVVLVAIIVGLIIAFSGKNENVEPQPIVDEVVTDSVATEVTEVVPNRADTLVIRVEGEEKLPQEDTVVTVQPTVQPSAPATPTATTKPTTSTSSSNANTTTQSGTHKLSYGSWTGGWRNGKPHGVGTMTYSTTHTIDSRDSKGRTAQPGEYVVGEWDNGNLVQGRWFKKDGSKEAIIIGKAG